MDSKPILMEEEMDSNLRTTRKHAGARRRTSPRITLALTVLLFTAAGLGILLAGLL